MSNLSKKQIEKLDPHTLKDLLGRGILQVVNNSNISPTDLTKQDTPEYKKHAHLRGRRITVSNAAVKYKIPNGTVSRWASAGYIAIIEKDGRKTFLDEADVAYCSEIHRQRGGQGKWLFNKNGTKYIPTTRPS